MQIRILCIVLLSMTFTLAQDQRATDLLTAVSETLASYDNIAIDFSYELVNRKEYIQQKEQGSLLVQGNAYLLKLMGITQLCDGKNTHTINPENEEILIEPIDSNQTSGLNPSTLFSFYKEGYRFEWDIKQPLRAGKTIQYIKLTPIDTYAQAAYLLLGIDIKTKHIYKLIEVGDNGTETTLTLRSFQYDTPVKPEVFAFKETDYPNYYIDRF